MEPLTVEIAPLAYAQTDDPWLGDYKPYLYQSLLYRLVEQALRGKETLCLFLTTPTGSGKTLGSYAYAINHQVPAFGVYPTNELIRDQERALRDWIDPGDAYRLLRIDSRQLDHWQDALDQQQHASTFETLMRWQPTILTNPDILFYTFFGLYHGPAGLSQQLFTLLGLYRLFIFDEFHLYNVKQIADVAFLVAALHTINPTYGRVLIFASATPESSARDWLRDRLHLPVEVVEGVPSDAPDARTIAHPIRLTLLPADLRQWKEVETLLAYLPDLASFLARHPQARLVTILDSVAGAIRFAQALRKHFPGRPVGEVHGLSSEQERTAALHCPFTVGTSTIEVGIDFQGAAEKDVLIFEARTAAQFVQRFGRLGRHKKTLGIPNWAIALVPEYVYHFLKDRLLRNLPNSQVDEVVRVEGDPLVDLPIARQELYSQVDEAYQKPEDFARYLERHAPAEFCAAHANAMQLFMPDDRERIREGLDQAIQDLTGKSANQAWAIYRQYQAEKTLQPLLTFRESGFEAAILDERGSATGFPAKRYGLFFLLRRGEFGELDEEEYRRRIEALASHWPEDAARELRYGRLIERMPGALLGVYGYFSLTGLLDKGRKVWFEVSEDVVWGKKAQVTVISGLEVVTDPPLRLRRLNRHLSKKKVVAWFVDRHPASIRLGRALPPLFELYELRVRRPGGALSPAVWSIAFNQAAFFLDSLGWWKEQREDQAIVL